MSRLIETTAAIEIIRTALAKHGSHPPTSETDIVLNRDKVSTMASVFQPRDRDGMYAADKRHTVALADAIGKNPGKPQYLDPVTVWWGGDRWYVVDGHHRVDAYAVRGVRTGIPCRVFRGTLDEAMAQSGLANSKDRLPMSKADKLDYAWRLVLTAEGLSKSTIARAASVAPRTVANMRLAKTELLGRPGSSKAGLIQDGWKRSDLAARGLDFGDTDYDPDEALKTRAAVYRDRLYKALGNKPYTDPEAFALALTTSDPRFPRNLLQTQAFREAFIEEVHALKDEGDAEHALAAAYVLEGMDGDTDY